MAQRIAKDVGASVWSVQHEKEADKLTTVRPLQWLAIGVIDQVRPAPTTSRHQPRYDDIVGEFD